jgi:hypothetical protein
MLILVLFGSKLTTLILKSKLKRKTTLILNPNRKNKKKINQETEEIKKQEQKKISLLSSVG